MKDWWRLHRAYRLDRRMKRLERKARSQQTRDDWLAWYEDAKAKGW